MRRVDFVDPTRRSGDGRNPVQRLGGPVTTSADRDRRVALPSVG